ncbi:MAG TPA: glycosyltransferase [Anaeromyxobacteraceae bacterium]|nr:glycosyltransferase [Anaeromyxobacteraceae bacterium]
MAALDRENPVAVGVNGWGFPEARAALGWCRGRGRIAVLMSDSQETDAPRHPLKELVKRWIVAQCDSALVAGRSHAAYLQKLGMPKERIALGYDVVDNDHFARGAEQARTDVGARGRLGLPERYFLASARFVEKKNLAGLLHAYAHYRHLSGGEAWDLVLLGDGPLRRQLGTLQAELGVAASVRFAGFKQYPELPAYYGLASAFVLASTSEPWGLVVNEAMAAGLPVLVSERCGAAELVRDGENGWRFDPRDPEHLGALMLRLTRLGGELDAFGRASRRIVADYGPDRFARGFLEAVELGREHSRRSSPSRVASWLLGA